MTRGIAPHEWPLLRPFFLWSMDWRGTGEWTWDAALADPHVARYVSGWGQHAGDDAVVACGEDGDLTGALWWRLFTADAPGYGFVSADIPELGLSTAPYARGTGVGTVLLSQAIERARGAGYSALSLSVEDGNEPARHLYLAQGFVTVGRVGNADTMVARW